MSTPCTSWGGSWLWPRGLWRRRPASRLGLSLLQNGLRAAEAWCLRWSHRDRSFVEASIPDRRQVHAAQSSGTPHGPGAVHAARRWSSRRVFWCFWRRGRCQRQRQRRGHRSRILSVACLFRRRDWRHRRVSRRRSHGPNGSGTAARSAKESDVASATAGYRERVGAGALPRARERRI